MQAFSSSAERLPIHGGTLLASSYEVQAFLGEGTFRKTAKCVDLMNKTNVALKITNDEPYFTEQELEEVAVLKYLQTMDSDKHRIVRWDGMFFHERFVCLTFELLDLSLRDYMQLRQFQPLSMGEIRPMLHQLITALVHMNDLRIVHADVKPEKIMIVNRHQQPLQVKLIDFGHSFHTSSAVQSPELQTLWYKAPEVMLDLSYSEPMDTWSLGVVAAELALGLPIFPGNDEYTVMKFIVDALGYPEEYQLSCGQRTTHFFNVYGSGNERVWKLKTPEEFVRGTAHRFTDTRSFDFLYALEKMMCHPNKAERKQQENFVDFLMKILKVDEYARLIPLISLRHPFFSVDQHTDLCQNTIAGHLTVPTQDLSITEQLFSQEESHGLESVISSCPAFSFSTERFPIHEGTLLASRYEVQAFLGEGTFGKVAKCVDLVTKTNVAIKITKDKPYFTEQALEEVAVLKYLQTMDSDKHHIVRWDGMFFHGRFVCLTFELLDLSLRDYMQLRQFQPLSMGEIRPMLHQLIMALVHMNDLRIVHADLKPENIMIVNHHQQPLQVKLIDFGHSFHTSSAVQSPHLQTLWYKAPEVMLDLSYSEPMDTWSLGVVAAELALGLPIFPGNDEYTVMKFIVDALGYPEEYQLNCGQRTTHFFNVYGSGNERVWKLKTPEEFFKGTAHRFTDTRSFDFLYALEKMMCRPNKAERKQLEVFVDFLIKILKVDENARLIPLISLRHPFFSVDQHTDLCQNTITEHLMVPTQDLSITEQLFSQEETNGPELVSVHAESIITGADKAVIQPQNEDISVGTSCVGKVFTSIRKFLSCWR